MHYDFDFKSALSRLLDVRENDRGPEQEKLIEQYAGALPFGSTGGNSQ